MPPGSGDRGVGDRGIGSGKHVLTCFWPKSIVAKFAYPTIIFKPEPPIFLDTALIGGGSRPVASLDAWFGSAGTVSNRVVARSIQVYVKMLFSGRLECCSEIEGN